MLSCGKKEAPKENINNNQPEIEQQVPKVDIIAEPEPQIEENVPEIIFTVQIAALKNYNENLLSIDGISTYDENNLTKYRLGNFITYEEARTFRSQILKEYKDAFVQALKNETPISIIEALQN
jgi:hypothetical protein